MNLPYNIRTLWFDPNGLELKPADDVIVNTARGLEMGRVAGDVFEATDEQMASLKSPLKCVERVATPEDIERSIELERKNVEAMQVFKEMARETSEDMHPVSVEFLFDGDKAIFYFESEERIDFRALVRRLASHFKVRVDMRQIGVRDEARIVGGIGHCGQIVCCKRLGGEFKPVSIRMAKDQDLSLNPQKISGLCGRLMCCLRYETDAYKAFKAEAPKVGNTVSTPDGPAKVESVDVPREMVKVRVEGEKPVSVPLTAFEKPEGGGRPKAITQEGWDEATSPEVAIFEGSMDIFSTSKFTGSDKLGSATAVHNPGAAADPLDEAPKKKRKRRQRKPSGGEGASSEGSSTQKQRQPRRRSTKIQGGRAQGQKAQEKSQDKAAKQKDGNAQKGANKKASGKQASSKGSSPRPGQKSSGLAHDGASKQGQGSGQPARRRRRRSHKPGNQQAGQRSGQKQSSEGGAE